MMHDPHLFYSFVIMRPGHTAEDGKSTLFDEIEKLKVEPVAEKELQKAKNQLEAEFIFDLQSVEDKGYAVGHYQTTLGDYSKLFEEAEKFQQVTAEDVMRVAQEYFAEKNRTVVVLVPEMPEEHTTVSE